MRIACDTGGTFTDLILEDDDGRLTMFKASTTPGDPVQGVLDAVRLAAESHGQPLQDFASRVDTFIHGTTHAINAVITGNTARTAFLTTAGHPDVLVLREGGRQEPFNFEAGFPAPYVPRSLTFEIKERVNSAGEILTPLDEVSAREACASMREAGVEAVAVCLLWSVANPSHEERIAAILAEEMPGTKVTLSHRLNPTIREFRRASATAIDASLKPLMTRYLGSLSSRLNGIGFKGRLLVLTSQGGMMDAADIAEKPILAINSGPSLAPVAGSHYGNAARPNADIVVADTGGTTYDVSLVRGGRIPLTRDAWIGPPFRGHLTGFPSVDVQSVGAGGGSIASVDEFGLLHVGPRSAGAQPGPVSYGRGGTEPTFSDACLALGYLDPDFFLGGHLRLDAAAARRAIERDIARPLGVSVEEAALAILTLGTENMVQAIADITVNQGIDPREAILIGGGGAAGLNSIFIARRLGIPRLVIPEVGAALSAAGALMSDLTADFRATAYANTGRFDFARVNAVLGELEESARAFIGSVGGAAISSRIEFSVEARYDQQVWEIEVPLGTTRIGGDDDVDALVSAMHEAHERIFTFRDERADVEVVGWAARAVCTLRDRVGRIEQASSSRMSRETRNIWLPGSGASDAPVLSFEAMTIDQPFHGPAIVESAFTTVVIDERASFSKAADGSLIIDLEDGE